MKLPFSPSECGRAGEHLSCGLVGSTPTVLFARCASYNMQNITFLVHCALVNTCVGQDPEAEPGRMRGVKGSFSCNRS